MSSSNKSNTSTAKNAETPFTDQIQEQVEKIVRSPIFIRSNRMQRFLRFTIEQTLKGEGDSLKEYPIALAVFDKPPSFDPRLDPIVRVEAGRLRSKLREYYEGPGSRDAIRIIYRKRSYVPHFEDQILLPGADKPTILPASDIRPLHVAAEGSERFRAIAVLPFINLSVSQKQEYFSDAITAEIINVLNQTVQVSIVSRTSVLRFKNTAEDIREIAKLLGVDAVLEGSVRLSAKRVRVAAQLADAATGYQIWSEIYDREITDIFDVQKDLAQSIARALKAKLHETQPSAMALFGTADSGAYHLYLRGRHFLKHGLQKDLKAAIKLFNKAISRDPGYAPAYVGIADAYATLSWWGSIPPQKCWLQVSEMTGKALQINETLGNAHIALAHLKSAWEWAWEDAEKEFLHGIELNPSYPGGRHLYGFTCLLPQGRLLEAEAELAKALELNPSSASISADLGWILCCKRQYELALTQLSQSVKLDPLFYRSYLYMGYAHEQQSDLDQALAAFMKAEELSRGTSAASGAVGRCLGLMGKRKAAMELLDRLFKRSRRTYVAAIDIANVYIGINEIESAYKCLEKAFTDQCPRLTHLNVNPAFDPMKSTSQFIDLLKKMRMDYSQA
jgi:TolB-like protein/Tfp pilus assembly protein PilF